MKIINCTIKWIKQVVLNYYSVNQKIFSIRKFADEFRSKVACENDVIQLMCNPYSRIAIYGASYGRTEYESLQCAQPSGVKEECKFTIWWLNYLSLVSFVTFLWFSHKTKSILINVNIFPAACPASYTTETVMRICHGQRKCSLTADSATFGKPCKPETRMYLKVVYTCGELLPTNEN